MLILSRKPGQSVDIGGDIRIYILEATGGRVKLGFEAPGHRVKRSELSDLPLPAEAATEAGDDES